MMTLTVKVTSFNRESVIYRNFLSMIMMNKMFDLIYVTWDAETLMP